MLTNLQYTEAMEHSGDFFNYDVNNWCPFAHFFNSDLEFTFDAERSVQLVKPRVKSEGILEWYVAEQRKLC